MLREVNLENCTAELFGDALLHSGALVFRSALPVPKLAHFKTRLNSVIDHYVGLTEQQIEKLDHQRWWPGNSLPFVFMQTRRGFVNDRMLQAATRGEISFYDLISDPRIHALTACAFPGMLFRPSLVTTCRRIPPSKPSEGWSPPVPLHCDIRYHRDAPFALNFWIPLDPAGERFESSGLEIWPMATRP